MSLFRSVFTVGFYTFLSRISGYMRDILMASHLGTSHLADAFNVAFKLPNFFRNIFADGALNAAFVPIFTAKLTNEGRDKALNFGGKVVTILLLSLICVVGLFEIFMPQIMKVLAMGFHIDKEKFALAVLFGRITFPYLLFISITTVYAGIMNSFGKFAVAAAIPILMNICMIIAVVFFSKHSTSPAHALAFGLFMAGILQLVSIIYASRRAGIILTFTKPKIDKDLRLMFRNMVPGIIGSSITQINLWVGTIIATNISGAVSILYYAERLNQFPLAIIGIALGTILLPTLTRQLREKEFDKAVITQNKALEISLFLTLPCAFALVLIGREIIQVLYERAAFTSIDTLHVSIALGYLALGLPAFVIIRIFTPRFFASLDTKTPVRISLISVTINIVLSYLLSKQFSFAGIAFASAVSGWVSAILLGYFLFKKHSFYFIAKFFVKIFLILIAATFMAIILLSYKYFAYDYMYLLLGSKILNLFFMIFCGSLSYFLVAYLLNIITISDFRR